LPGVLVFVFGCPQIVWSNERTALCCQQQLVLAAPFHSLPFVVTSTFSHMTSHHFATFLPHRWPRGCLYDDRPYYLLALRKISYNKGDMYDGQLKGPPS